MINDMSKRASELSDINEVKVNEDKVNKKKENQEKNEELNDLLKIIKSEL